MAGRWDWVRARSLPELVALWMAILVLGWLGWDQPLWDARQQAALHMVAGIAVAGLAVHAIRGGALPRTPIDVPVLALLAAFALATVTALNLGMSLRAMGSILAFGAMLPAALLAVRHRPTWVGLVVSVPVLAMAIPTLGMLVIRRVEWVLVGAPGLPPLRLLGEGTPFGSVAVPPFVIWPAWALAGLIEPPLLRRGMRIALLAVGIPLTILSGSRSAWLAIAATLLVAGVPWAWRRRHRLRFAHRLTARNVLTGLALAGAAVIAGLVVVPRLTAVTSLVYRADLWRDTLRAWGTDPVMGIGPGFMPFARQAAAPDFSFPVRQPHSHNLPLGILGDAGLVGIAAAVTLVVAIAMAAGPWRSRTATGRAAALVLVGLGVGGLFEDLTFLPNFNLIAIALLAVALTDAGAVRWVRPASWGRSRRVAALAGAGLIGLAVLPAALVADAGAIAHRQGAEAWLNERWETAAAHFRRALEIDPWHPGPPKALAIAAEQLGELELAREAARTAVALNPGDGPSWTNLAIICGALGDDACQATAASRAVAKASFLGLELANAALAFESLGMTEEADDAYRRSLLSQWLTGLSLEWPREVVIGDPVPSEGTGAQFEMSRLLAWWAMDEPIEPGLIVHPAVRGLAHAIRGERSEADELIDTAIATAVDDPITWQVAIVVRDHWGESVEHELRVYHVLRGGRFPPRAPSTGPPGLTFELAGWRGYPRDEFVSDAERLRTAPAYPWTIARALP